VAWCGTEDELSDMRGIEVLALRLRGIEPRRSRAVAAEGNIGSSCREDTSGWRVSWMCADCGQKMKASRTLPSSVLRTRGTPLAGQESRRSPQSAHD
jgi:hypothetical protein